MLGATRWYRTIARCFCTWINELRAMISIDVIGAGFFGYAATAAAYFVLFLLVVRWWNRALSGGLLMAASAMTSLWAGTTAYSLRANETMGPLAEALEVLCSAGWMLLLLGLLYWIPPARRLTW